MEDIYSAIVGEPTSDKEKLLMLAQKLRKQQMLGQLGQITGDRVLSPMGAGMVKQASEQAEDIGRRGETARYRRYQEAASERMDAREKEQLAWNKENAKLQRAMERELAAARNATTLAAAKIRAEATTDKAKKYKAMTVKQVEDLTAQYEDARQYSSVIEDFKDDYAGFKIPGVRALTNSMAAHFPIAATEGQEKAQDWWTRYNNLYTLPERNRLFGATLTPNEQKAWAENAITTNMSAAQIREKLAWFESKTKEKLAAMSRNFKAANFDPELVDTIFSDPIEESETEDVDIP